MTHPTRESCNRVIALALGLLFLRTEALAQSRDILTLELRTLAEVPYPECTILIMINMFTLSSPARMRCVTGSGDKLREHSHSRELQPDEIKKFLTLAPEADLYGDNREGASWLANISTFETLTASCCGRHTRTVLITSGNRSFDKGTPRGQLRELLRALLRELQQQIVLPPR